MTVFNAVKELALPFGVDPPIHRGTLVALDVVTPAGIEVTPRRVLAERRQRVIIRIAEVAKVEKPDDRYHPQFVGARESIEHSCRAMFNVQRPCQRASILFSQTLWLLK